MDLLVMKQPPGLPRPCRRCATSAEAPPFHLCAGTHGGAAQSQATAGADASPGAGVGRETHGDVKSHGIIPGRSYWNDLEWSSYHSVWKWLWCCVLQILIIPLLYKEDTIGFHTSVRSQGTFLDTLIWVCLKIVYPIVPNGFADHYPY